MKSRRTALAVAAAVALIVPTASLAWAQTTERQAATPPAAAPQAVDPAAAAPGGTFMEQFDGPIDSNFWYTSDGYNNGGHQNCQFNKKNSTVANGLLSLSIDDTAYGDRKYSCGSIQTNQKYHWGTYETRMLTGKASGTNSSLFTYAGPYQGIPKSHEIDFETLGKDTTKTELNSWVNGSPKGPQVVDLGLDNSQEWVNLGFVWLPDSLKFYVNGQFKGEFTGADVPYEPQLILTMIWGTDTLTGWMGPFEYPGRPIVSQYDYVAYTKAGDPCQFEGSVACGVKAPKASFVDNFDTLDTSRWAVSHNWNNGAQQNCQWDKGQVTAADGTLNLSFTKKTLGDRQYACAEVKYAKPPLGYGVYETRMKGVKASGLLSALFTYIAASGDTPAEALDFKLLGKDTGNALFNVWQGGELTSTKVAKVTGGADKAFVDYGMIWTAEKLEFYVNGTKVYEVTDPAKIPKRATTPFFTIWASDTLVDEMGRFKDPGTVTFQVDRFAYTAPGEECQFTGSIACT